MIEEKKIKDIAKLARLNLDTKELERLAKDLLAILDYIDQLNKLDVSAVNLEPDASRKHQREDLANSALSQQADLLSLAPDKEKGYIKVKSVFKHES